MNTFTSFLIIDDCQDSRYILKRILNKNFGQSQIFESDSGEHGYQFLSDFDTRKKELGGWFPPTIVFLDINMPGISGFDFLEKFSKLRDEKTEFSTSFFIMYSSSENKNDFDSAFQYKFVKSFVVKGKDDTTKIKEKVEMVLAA